jgi:deazaflavin-dependent oxidoreductase (nitroreductase family)
MSTNPRCMDQQLRRGIDTRVAKLVSPAMLNIAGTRFRSLSILRHVGRRSGREYATPITAFPLGDGFVIALLYGDVATVDWCRNVMAAGACTIKVLGQDIALERPEIIPASDALVAHPSFWRYMLKARKIDQFLWVHRAGSASQPGEA